MGTAYFGTTANWSIGSGTKTYSFNPGGDALGATVTNVRYSFFIDHDGGKAVDLAKVDIWLRSPDGKQVRIYDNADNPFRVDTDDNNDSDGGNDYDISFWGTDSKSDISFFMDGNQVNGTWKLVVENDTGKTLTNHHLKVWVDYDAPADLLVKDINIVGTQDVGQPVLAFGTSLRADKSGKPNPHI